MSSVSDGVVVGSKLVNEISKLDDIDEIRLKDNLDTIIRELKNGIK